jgi:mannose-6-phosphate isomerase-like protein (cupin superfamily)
LDVAARDVVVAFTTKDGSTIRELHHTELQSLAEATLAPGQQTERHYHRVSEEIYVLLDGSGLMEIDGDERRLVPEEAVLIPAGAWHTIRNDGEGELRFLCCCAPAYSHDDTYFA